MVNRKDSNVSVCFLIIQYTPKIQIGLAGGKPISHRYSFSARDLDIAELDRAMIALEIDGTRHSFLTVEGAAGDAGYFLVADHGPAVQGDGHQSPDQGNIVGLPFTRIPGEH